MSHEDTASQTREQCLLSFVHSEKLMQASAGDTSLQEPILVQNQSYVIEGTELWINNAYRQGTYDARPLMHVDQNFSNKHMIRL